MLRNIFHMAAHLLSQAEIVKAPPQLRSNNERGSGASTPSMQSSVPINPYSDKGRNSSGRKRYGDSGYYDQDDDNESVDRFLPSIRPPVPKNKIFKSQLDNKKNSPYVAASIKALGSERGRDKGRAEEHSDREERGRSRSVSPLGTRTEGTYHHHLRVSTSPSLNLTPGNFLFLFFFFLILFNPSLILSLSSHSNFPPFFLTFFPSFFFLFFFVSSLSVFLHLFKIRRISRKSFIQIIFSESY